MYRIEKKSWICRLALGAFCMAALPATASEIIYGPPTTSDQGEKRVAPVTTCTGGGYVAVGTLNTAAGPRAYVVRTSPTGGNIWEISYDIGNDLAPDYGQAIAEDGSGFVVAGSSRANNLFGVFLLKIDCAGAPQWTQRYTTTVGNLYGRDLVRATSGSAAVGTAAGDLLVAGYVDFTSTSSDAFLMRTRSNGNLIWNKRYSAGVAIERFFGLTQASPGATPTGDVVGVGVWAPAGATTQALAVRVNGDTGLIGAAPQCAFTYGGIRDESFNSVIELRTAPQTGNLAMAGRSTTPGLGEDIYLVKTQRNPCMVLAQSTIGNMATGPMGEVATDIKEVLVAVDASLGVPLGSLALTGYRGTATGTQLDAHLLFTNATNLFHITGRLYGDHATRNDSGASLAQNPVGGANPPGFVIAGMSESDFAAVGDPRDLYQIHTDNKANTNCSINWSPISVGQTWVSTSPAVSPANLVTATPVATTYVTYNTIFTNCP